MMKKLGKFLSIALGLILLVTSFVPITAQAAPVGNILASRWVPSKPAHTKIMEWQSQTVIEIKFAEGTSYRLSGGRMTSLGNDNLAALQAALKQHPLQSIERLFTQPEQEISAEKISLEAASNEQMPDLNLWYRFTVQDGTNAEALIDALNAMPEVEIAYPATLPSPLPTPNYITQQAYLIPATPGVDAKYAWTLPGGTGSRVTIVDVEYSFNQSHEDLPAIPVIGGQEYNGFGDDHGTAVMGELVSKNNGLGVKGISYGAVVKFSSACMDSFCSNYNPANAINTARANTANGDVILIEQQTPVCGLADYGPLEWIQSVYDAIKFATAAGRNVVEAAGNGSVNLDGAGCSNKFNKTTRDSGAIIVGAGSPPNSSQTDRSRLYFSSYGSRVDVQGWGGLVVTTGYGNLYSGTGQNQWYTNSFSGTSSASPIVAGSVALLSSIAEQRGSIKSPAWIRSTLISTGSPQQAAVGYPVSQHIGPRPNLKAAIAKLAVAGFNSPFTTNATGWSAVKGVWTVNTTSGIYSTTGIPKLLYHSVRHINNYSTLTYEARMKRTTCHTCANDLIIRGNPSAFTSNGLWKNGYVFQYQNSGSATPSQGAWKALKIKNGVTTSLGGWTASTFINPYNWNTLKVTAKGSALKFYINGHLVWSGTDTGLTTGQVGIGMYQGNIAATMGTLFVDWAKLSPAVP